MQIAFVRFVHAWGWPSACRKYFFEGYLLKLQGWTNFLRETNNVLQDDNGIKDMALKSSGRMRKWRGVTNFLVELIMYCGSQLLSGCSIVGKLLCYHASGQGSIPREGDIDLSTSSRAARPTRPSILPKLINKYRIIPGLVPGYRRWGLRFLRFFTCVSWGISPAQILLIVQTTAIRHSIFYFSSFSMFIQSRISKSVVICSFCSFLLFSSSLSFPSYSFLLFFLFLVLFPHSVYWLYFLISLIVFFSNLLSLFSLSYYSVLPASPLCSISIQFVPFLLVVILLDLSI